MSNSNARAAIQVIILIGITIFAMLTGWACDCGSGSDYSSSGGGFTTHDAVNEAEGAVDRWHDFTQENLTPNAKDLQTFYSFVEDGRLGFGILVPQAPDATQPGILLEGVTPNIYAQWNENGETLPIYTFVPLTTSQELADQLTALIPPPPETRWQALVPIPGDWMANIPIDTTNIENFGGSLYYGLDFQGVDFCNHCEVKLTACSSTPLTAPQQFMLNAFGESFITSDEGLTCAQPVPTYIMLSDPFGGDPPPGPIFASFGPFGGVVYTTTMQSDFSIFYSLRHSTQTTQTLTLSQIGSSQGWEYEWADLEGTPISQISVGPMGDNIHADGPFFEDNLQVIASGLPTCTNARDTIYLTATMVTTPSIQAIGSTVIEVLPDPALCIVADLGIDQIASTSQITAGNWVTFTFAITNFETTAQSIVVTQTLTPGSAVEDVSVPAGCTWAQAAGLITCTQSSVPPGSSLSLEIAVQAAATFTGELNSMAEVQPQGGADSHYYDNVTGWLAVNVTGGVPPSWQVFLPCINRH